MLGGNTLGHVCTLGRLWYARQGGNVAGVAVALSQPIVANRRPPRSRRRRRDPAMFKGNPTLRHLPAAKTAHSAPLVSTSRAAGMDHPCQRKPRRLQVERRRFDGQGNIRKVEKTNEKPQKVDNDELSKVVGGHGVIVTARPPMAWIGRLDIAVTGVPAGRIVETVPVSYSGRKAVRVLLFVPFRAFRISAASVGAMDCRVLVGHNCVSEAHICSSIRSNGQSLS